MKLMLSKLTSRQFSLKKYLFDLKYKKVCAVPTYLVISPKIKKKNCRFFATEEKVGFGSVQNRSGSGTQARVPTCWCAEQ